MNTHKDTYIHITNIIALLWNVQCPKRILLGLQQQMWNHFIRRTWVLYALSIQLNNTQQNKLLHFTAVSKDMATSYLIPLFVSRKNIVLYRNVRKSNIESYNIVNWIYLFAQLSVYFRCNSLRNHFFTFSAKIPVLWLICSLTYYYSCSNNSRVLSIIVIFNLYMFTQPSSISSKNRQLQITHSEANLIIIFDVTNTTTILLK